MVFSPEVLEDYLRKIYDGFDVSSEIEPTAWREVLRIINMGAVQGLSDGNLIPTHQESFLHSLRHSNEVFSAFKVHSMSTKMAERLLGEDGKLRSFEEWRKAVAPIARHQVGSWLRTEYDTAVIRAHQAADWIEFEANKDILPNLQWMPTTSPSPEVGHEVFWRKPVILPIDDPFWSSHRPGDRWNCKCSLEATDAEVQRLDTEESKEAQRPERGAQRGLEGSPLTKGLITDKHPYYPDSCAKCPFYASKGIKGWARKHLSNRVKDCHNCPYIDLKLFQAKLSEQYPLDRWEHTFISDSGGYVVTERSRITEGKVNSTEREKFIKELETAKVMAKHGHAIAYLGESGRTRGETYDILLDGIRCEIKCFPGKQGGAIEKQLKHAFRDQGAETVVVRLEERGGRAYEKLTTCLKTQKLLKDKTIYFFWMDAPEELEIFPSRQIVRIK